MRRYAELTKDNVVKCFLERFDDLVPVFESHEDYPDPIEVTDQPDVELGDVYNHETKTFSKPAPVEPEPVTPPKLNKKAK
jgi:hypothetical protein